MVVRAVITILCGVGLYVSIFMLRKSVQAARGALTERSVVEQPQARLFFGLPNAALGTVFYAFMAAGAWLAAAPWQSAVLLGAAALAAATSAYLTYSLLFVTRMPCKFCFTSHGVNGALLLGTAWLFKLSYWQ